jgi:D-inositol-3-phosphate glycosyltransferase
MQRVAILSMHTSPLAQPGVGDGGGMNVYVRELVSSLASSGVDCTTYTRKWKDDLPEVIEVEPNHRVVHVQAGEVDLPKEELLR